MLTSIRFLESPSTITKLTPNDHASLVIRVIECITAHHPVDSDGQCERQQTLGSDWEGSKTDASLTNLMSKLLIHHLSVNIDIHYPDVKIIFTMLAPFDF